MIKLTVEDMSLRAAYQTQCYSPHQMIHEVRRFHRLVSERGWRRVMSGGIRENCDPINLENADMPEVTRRHKPVTFFQSMEQKWTFGQIASAMSCLSQKQRDDLMSRVGHTGTVRQLLTAITLDSPVANQFYSDVLESLNLRLCLEVTAIAVMEGQIAPVTGYDDEGRNFTTDKGTRCVSLGRLPGCANVHVMRNFETRDVFCVGANRVNENRLDSPLAPPHGRR